MDRMVNTCRTQALTGHHQKAQSKAPVLKIRQRHYAKKQRKDVDDDDDEIAYFTVR